jgi:hypothetical protein
MTRTLRVGTARHLMRALIDCAMKIYISLRHGGPETQEAELPAIQYDRFLFSDPEEIVSACLSTSMLAMLL